MSIGKDGSQRPVPTLTEVVQLPSDAAGAGRNPTNPVVTPTLRKMSVDDTKRAGHDAARNRLATALPPPTLPPVLAPGSLPVASSPIAIPSAMFVAAPPTSPAAVIAPVAVGVPQAPATPVEPALPVAPAEPVAAVEPAAPAAPDASAFEVDLEPTATPEPGSAEEERLIERVLADLQRHIDLVLEHKLREALAPAFERIAQMLLVETRAVTSQGLRTVVAASVARELERTRLRARRE